MRMEIAITKVNVYVGIKKAFSLIIVICIIWVSESLTCLEYVRLLLVMANLVWCRLSFILTTHLLKLREEYGF